MDKPRETLATVHFEFLDYDDFCRKGMTPSELVKHWGERKDDGVV